VPGGRAGSLRLRGWSPHPSLGTTESPAPRVPLGCGPLLSGQADPDRGCPHAVGVQAQESPGDSRLGVPQGYGASRSRGESCSLPPHAPSQQLGRVVCLRGEEGGAGASRPLQ